MLTYRLGLVIQLTPDFMYLWVGQLTTVSETGADEAEVEQEIKQTIAVRKRLFVVKGVLL